MQKNYLVEAAIWSSLVTPFRDNQILSCDSDTLALVCDVMIRKGRFLPALRALQTGLKADPFQPSLCVILVKFVSKFSGGSSITCGNADVKGHMQSVIKEELATLLGGGDIQAFTLKCEKNSMESSLEHRISVARMVVSTDRTNGKLRALYLLTDDNLWEGKGVTITALEEVLKVLTREMKVEESNEALKNFMTKGLEKFPNAKIFNLSQIEVENLE